MALPTSKRFSLLWAFAIATLCALALRLFVLEDFRVASGSMRPGLVPGDFVFAWKSAYNIHLPFTDLQLVSLSAPERGDVVLFGVPGEYGQTFLKRVVAVEGDQLQIKFGKLWLNGKSVGEEPVSRQLAQNEPPTRWELLDGKRYAIVPSDKDYGPIQIPKSHFFAVGDNRADSTDSRVWGPIPYSFLRGRLLGVWAVGSRDGAD